MSLTHFPNGLTSFGVPIVPSVTPNITTGSVFFVDSNTGSDVGGAGKSPSTPFATLDYAMGKCTANKGDIIYLMPKHAETITGAGGITFDIAGVSVIGLGHYDARPRFLMDGAATVTCLVTAANCKLANCVFAAGHSDVATFSTITAKGFIAEGNHFERNTTNENFVKIFNAGVADNDCDGLQLLFNTMDFGGDAGELTPIILNKDTANVRIIGNKIYGDFDTSPYAAIYSPNTEHHMDIEIAYNFIHNLHDANAVVGISMGSTTSTGFMHNNYVYALDVAGETPFVSAATGISLFQNWYNYTGGTSSGLVLPAIGTLS